MNTQQYGLSATKHLKETPNALALAINLQPLGLKDQALWLQTATPEDIEQHKGLRTSFVIVDMLFPGFTYISGNVAPNVPTSFFFSSTL